MKVIRRPSCDVHDRPFLVIWEVTQACDLACRHCRAEARPDHDPLALSFEAARGLIDQVESFGTPRPLFIFTGGDPFKRADLFDLVSYASEQGLPVAVSPSGTPRLNRENLLRLKEAGAKAISLSVDGSTALRHDDFRRVPGSFDLTLAGWQSAQSVGLKLQINTTVSRYNLFDLPDIFALVRRLGAMTWSVFFLVPTGRGLFEDQISPEAYEAVLNFLYDASKYMGIKTTEGHHYKRVVLQRTVLDAQGLPPEEYLPLDKTYRELKQGLARVTAGELETPADRMRRAPMHVGSGSGFVFISHRGDVFPSGFLPLSGGNVRERSLVEIYRESPLFRGLRDLSQLKGRCGRCEFAAICGGSRSRSYAVTGDTMAEEPSCVYQAGTFPFADEVKTLVAQGSSMRR